ncbi:MAG: PilZ domain-containing protein [Roseibium sp.]|nr:PilZ domain-containing protein [Roseibium sp.]
MDSEEKSHPFEHLMDQPGAEEPVLVVDLDNLAVIDAVLCNVNEWGCGIKSADAKDLYKNIGIRTEGARKLIKAQITSVKGENAAVVFLKAEASVADKRREKRNDVSLPVKISDLEGLTEITGKIVDAGKNGCRIKAEGLTSLPEEVVLTMNKVQRPVIAEFAWRNETFAGLRLLWHRTLEETENTAVA